jgi:hypothetical protein
MEPNFDRINEFRDEISSMDLKTPADENERWFLLGGIGLMAVGGLAILGGYWGASGTAILAQQLPYLISGGVLGLGFVIAGAAMFVRYSMSRYLRFWLIRTIYEQRAQTDRVVASMNDVESLLRTATRPRTRTPD